MGHDPTESHGNLFPIFLLGLIQFFLTPITVFRVGSWLSEVFWGDKEKSQAAAAAGAVTPTDASSEWGKAAAAHAARNRPTVKRRVQGLFKGFNLYLVIFWGVSGLLVAYISLTSVEEPEVFDPYAVLNVPVGADAATVKRAYRTLSLQYHPDKNPDPEATKFFTESITPAYKALTDEVARANYEKYGHPDGKQPVKLGVALPSWMFGSDGSGPIVLCCLVAFGILLPLGFAVIVLLRMNKYTGSGGILRQTQYYLMSEFKPLMTLSRVPKVLSVAAEYIQMPYARGHEEGVRKLLTILRSEYDNKDPKFLKRHPAIIKAHMLLLAQACRQTDQVDPALQADMKKVLSFVPTLMEESLKIALGPVNNLGYCFMRPALSFLEFSQCFTQAVAPSARKTAGGSDKVGQSGDSLVSLLQLPHVDERIATLLNRKKCRSLSDLLAIRGAGARAEVLKVAGLTEGAVADVEAHLKFVPRAEVFTASVETEGEDAVAEFDVVTCTVNLKMARGALPAEKDEGKEGDEGGDSAAVITRAGAGGGGGGFVVTSKEDLPPLPFCQHCERKEGWWIFVTDPASNYTL